MNELGFIEDNNLGFIEEQPTKMQGIPLKDLRLSDFTKNADLTPTGIVRTAMNIVKTPQYSKENNKDLFNAYLDLKAQTDATPKNLAMKGADFASVFAFPALNLLKGAGLGAKIGNAALTGAYQGSLIGGVQGLQEGKPLEGLASGAGVGGTFGAGLPVVGKLATPIKKTLENPIFQKGFGKVEELLTSVPSEYTERALQQELAGNSIFKGKFDSKNLNEAYNEVGQRAIAGMKNAEQQANAQIDNALNNLPNKAINQPQLMIDLTKGVEQYAHGGRYNPALAEKGDDILHFLNELGNPENKTVDFHGIKSSIQSLLRGKYGKDSGDGINALKGISAKVREKLNSASPEYAQANANREALHEIKDSLGGMNRKTIGSNLRNVEGDAKVRAGYSQAAEELENLVAPKYKFMDEVKDLRAREALEQWFPGQFGGFGTKEGAANLLRGLVGGSAITATHNPIFALAFSPKISGKGTIQNLGRIYQNIGKEIPEPIRRLMTLGAVNAIPLQGEVQYNDYR